MGRKAKQTRFTVRLEQRTRDAIAKLARNEKLTESRMFLRLVAEAITARNAQPTTPAA